MITQNLLDKLTNRLPFLSAKFPRLLASASHQVSRHDQRLAQRLARNAAFQLKFERQYPQTTNPNDDREDQSSE